MSGPKGYQVRVESAEERRRRETSEVQARCDQMLIKLDGLRGAGVEAAVPQPSGRGLEALSGWEAALRDALASAEGRYSARLVATRRQRIEEMVDASASAGPIRIELPGVSCSGATRPIDTGSERADWGQRIGDLMGLASQVDDDALHQVVADSVVTLTTLASREADAYWLGLRHRVATAVQQSRELARVRSEAADLVARVAHLEGPAVDDLEARAGRARTSRDLSELARDVETMVVEAEAAADAEFIAREARAVLIELGYQVDIPFDVVGMDARALLARRRDLPDHELRIQVNEGSGTLLTSVVSREGTTPTEDVAAERATCADAKELMVALERRGVHSEKSFARDPGERPVRRDLTGAVSGRKRAARRGERLVPHEREIGR
ncbi:hypothetical protein SAMN02745244_03553 [Tessaracoccus bendigoensis DSM 12906]|uniref:Uncharacterized protein n=1 Tax=Tessaracoccus bendigoensis DSM 12906 TaxID=1123357 RepID=A0A1M6N4U2_9ACTN|nr:hypothetical protein [Tessaracoccus bendigoensis]SHJ90656.1 hypothetical protein SAMN02745244_03553 [Tessaracoccus bendigoensis DSM 12906]